AAKIAQERKRDADLLRPGFVCERTVHTYTQDLGVGTFQSFELILEGLHLLLSTAGEGEDIEGKHDVLFSVKIGKLDLITTLVAERKVRSGVADCDLWLGWCVLRRCALGNSYGCEKQGR